LLQTQSGLCLKDEKKPTKVAIRDDVLYQELNEILDVQYHKSFNRHIEGTIEMDETSTQIHVQTSKIARCTLPKEAQICK
jgi:hypothetical protein